jgi:hypothetical protein
MHIYIHIFIYACMCIKIYSKLFNRCELARYPNYIYAYEKYAGQTFENKVSLYVFDVLIFYL